jgi:NAD-dependent deacetylase sirtuin 4
MGFTRVYQWAAAMEASESGIEMENNGIRLRPDGDVEIDESFWEGRLIVPGCQRCQGMLKPNVYLNTSNYLC